MRLWESSHALNVVPTPGSMRDRVGWIPILFVEMTALTEASLTSRKRYALKTLVTRELDGGPLNVQDEG